MLVSVGLMAWNCEAWISGAIETAKLFADEIVIGIDQKTNDHTREVIQKLGITNTYEFKFTHFGLLNNILVNHCKAKWFMLLDPDEIILKESALKIRSILKTQSPDIDMYYFPRKGWFDWERKNWHSKAYPDYQFRLFKNNGIIKYPNRPVHISPNGFKKAIQIPYDIHLEHFGPARPKEYVWVLNALYQSLAKMEVEKKY